MKTKAIIPFEATHPGAMIKDEMKERNITQQELAEMTGIDSLVLGEIMEGKRPLSFSVATALEKSLDIPTEMWMNMQTQYDIDCANIAERDNESVFASARILIETLLKKVEKLSDADIYELNRIDGLVNPHSLAM